MKEITRLLYIMKRLRDPESGCPWDKEQTIDSIKAYTIEEAYEVVDAIERQSMEDLKDELGDLLFHVIFYSEMADEQNSFDFRQVVNQVADKLERRHPHVFADLKLDNSEEVKQLWEKTKQNERDKKANNQFLLDDISIHMPALIRALKIQKRVASVGFDWEDIRDVLSKITEELTELKEAIELKEDAKRIQEELGDALFSILNLARHLKIDPETALRQTNEKFISRFNYIEEALKNQNRRLEESSLEEMDDLWNEAKIKQH